MPDKYGDVIIPMTVLRRLECTLEPTKDKVLAAYRADPDRAPKALCRDATEIRHPMRKNQGEKRYELTRADREEIVRLYSDFDDSDPRVKVFDYREFEYREYTVIQPMRRNYALSEERLEVMLEGRTLNAVWDEETIERLQAKDELKPSEEKRLKRLMGGKPAYDAIVGALRAHVSDEAYDTPEAFDAVLRHALAGCDVTAALRAKIAAALSERDEDAPIQKDRRGNVIYDGDTKDTERVPMLVDVDEYMEREVHPYVKDAHVTFDEDLTKKKPVIKTGAEIPFTRYFYKYQEPEEPEDVLAEVLALDAQADAGLKALMGGE
ncbi:MAG: hypothetical protein IKF78_11990 [Atopobiaceae bacterium]|nr:hypothetical protein [Atopobiaceae bacterium]